MRLVFRRRALEESDLHPRTAVGIKADGQVLIMIVDGELPASSGPGSSSAAGPAKKQRRMTSRERQLLGIRFLEIEYEPSDLR